MKRFVALFILTALICMTSTALAVPGLISYQGKLTDSSGEPLNGTYSMRFDLFNSSSGGSSLWNETQNVNVNSGMYDVHLGSATTLPPTLFAASDILYLQVSILNSSRVYEVLSPRQRLTSSPYAMHAADADTLGGMNPGSFAGASHSHDSRYYTQTQVNTYLSGKSDTTHTHDSRYYTQSEVDTRLNTKANTTHSHSGSDITSGTISLSGSVAGDAIIKGTNSNTTGRGVQGEVSGASGRGVLGVASNTGSVTNYGGYFTAAGASGRGVFGWATDTSETINHGGYFSAWGESGRGVFGTSPGTSGSGVFGVASNTGSVRNYGGYFTAAGASGRGVHAEASKAGFHTNYGGYFSAAGDFGKGVFGQVTGPGGRGVEGVAKNTGDFINFGGYFTAAGLRGRAVYGNASSTGDLSNYGGYFTAAGASGRGVYGEASGASGRGVEGRAPTTGHVENYGGYFSADGHSGKGVYGEASGQWGMGVLGVATGYSGRGVSGYATNRSITTTTPTYGGYFSASGTYGIGVYGHAAHGRGVEGEASGQWGWGVYGRALGYSGRAFVGDGYAYNFYASGPGVNYGPFTGAHEVLFTQDMPTEIVPGMIVSVTGKAEARVDDNGKISLSSTLPTVTLSSKAMDKAVFGVLVRELPLGEDHWYQAQENERFGVVNALGEGRMWVCDVNGNIEAGDYVTSSNIPGYGQLQEDDLLHSYTVGKAIETVEWDTITETVVFDGLEVKVYLIAVVYTSG